MCDSLTTLFVLVTVHQALVGVMLANGRLLRFMCTWDC